MFGEEKATVLELRQLEKGQADSARNVWAAIMQLQTASDTQERRLDRYANRLTSMIQDISNLRFVVDRNAEQSTRDQDALKEAYVRLEECKIALELLASELGKELTTLPAVEAKVTIQPGLPERIGLAKAPKGAVAKAAGKLPAPVTLTASELERGLSLVY